jgi:hypothetical protein
LLLALIARFCRGLVASRQAVAELSGNMVGNNKARSGNSIRRSQAKRGAEQIGGGGGYGVTSGRCKACVTTARRGSMPNLICRIDLYGRRGS